MNTLKQLRQATGLTQKEFAEKLGIDRTTVTKWETGKAFPKAKMLPQLSVILNVSISKLLNAS